MESVKQAVEPSIVHKSDLDDVLVADPDIIVPAHINIRHLDVDTVHALTNGDAAPYRRDEEQLVLRTLPSAIENSEALGAGTFDFSLSGFYELIDGRLSLVAHYIPQGVERILNEKFIPTMPALSSSEKASIISLLKERWLAFVPARSYKMLNDTQNYFFYRKEHEHVPGLMIIEVARQAMYHYFYDTYTYRRGDVTISMSDLTVAFQSYMESAYGVEVVVKQTAALVVPSPKHVDVTATFFQNSRPVAEVRLRGGVMKTPVFNRLRTLTIPEHHWFTPSGRVGRTALLDFADGTSLSAVLKELSPRAFIVQPSKAIDPALKIERCILTATGFGLVPFNVSDSYEIDDNAIVLDLSLSSQAKVNTLRDILKRHCFFLRAESMEASCTEIHPELVTELSGDLEPARLAPKLLNTAEA
jgi:A-factor biosynthesis hotdog domain